MPDGGAWVVALVGAESTGKTTLAAELAEALPALWSAHAGPAERARWPRPQAARVGEYLREFCDLHQRTPTRDEQQAIAREQSRRIAAACRQHPVVVADTTALLTAVYSEQVFGDTSLHVDALAMHRCQVHLTLLTGLDLPWQADGLQRDGPQVREPVDHKLRRALLGDGQSFSVVSGSGGARLEAALAICGPALRRHLDRTPPTVERPRWRHLCGRCGDPACEQLTLRLARDS
ncbi:nicotinamide riboside kinase [Sphaerotilus hippei]|uniref:Nicotinamide riboside kinase n=1 Tax=Sphaerotilus hippei TaxID=744406 RepID=A0A318H3E4_9BURK|nr:ATP-binding protein [Sphaerotilus hippei]PXW96222.1 nicotinamide riboside kinase [Sphaerotilus hippei]